MKPPRAAVALRVIIHSAHLPLSVGNPQIPGSLLQGHGEPMRSQISRNITCSRRKYRQPQYLTSDMDHIDACKLDA